MAEFCSARSETIPPLPWTNFAPPFPAAAFVRNAALAVAADDTCTVPDVLPPGFLELIKRIYLGTYMLSTLKRDEMIHEGRGEELYRTVQAARDIQHFLLGNTSK